MNLTPEMKAKIDSWDYATLLSKWRFAPVGDRLFQGETGEYVSQRMKELQASGVDTAAASKKVGW